MANEKIIISTIKQEGFFQTVYGTTPKTAAQDLQASYKNASGQWIPMGSAQKYDTRDFQINLTNPPAKGKFDVKVCPKDAPSSPECSDPYPYDFVDFGNW
ncbi:MULTISPECIES: hypothetical protein [unclassified Pseudomonas]|uniref:hypothetical protein n=1 Tax=unclassified Pseudomonas TaxID=196821 RepID=UPI000A1F498D|nr:MULTISPECIES: hypothetical protein [unclassified Pseudomonas]